VKGGEVCRRGQQKEVSAHSKNCSKSWKKTKGLHSKVKRRKRSKKKKATVLVGDYAKDEREEEKRQGSNQGLEPAADG